MNCQHCQHVLPENYTASFCPNCGNGVSLEVPVDHRKPRVPVKTNWRIFFSALLGPALLTLLVALVGREQDGGSEVAGLVGTYFSIAGGIVCGIILGLRVGDNLISKIIVSFLLSGFMAFVCLTLCFFGCLAVGSALNSK